MKKNKIDLIKRYIYLEKWLKDNYPINMTDKEIIKYFCNNFDNKHDVEYLIEAYSLPYEEFEIEMTKEAKKGFDININALGDTLAKKYSISKDKALKRVRQMLDINVVKQETLKQEKFVKPKLDTSYDKISDIISKYIKKNKKDDLDRKVLLEKWLDDNYIDSSEKMINYIYCLFNNDDAEYLTKAYFMPRNEIVSFIKKYNVNNPSIFEWVIQELITKYDTDRDAVLLRIEEVVVINYLINKEKTEKNTKKRLKDNEKDNEKNKK